MASSQTDPPSQNRAMRPSLFAVCRAMTSTLKLDDLLELILDQTLEELKAARGSILLYDEEHDTLKMLASRGMPEEVQKRGYIPRKGSIAEWVMENDEPLLLIDKTWDPRVTSISESPLNSSICCPLRAKNRIIGTLNLSRLSEPPFHNEDLDTLLIMATQAAISIENARLAEENVKSARMAAVGQTVSGISHCIKNMLTSLKGGLALGEMGIQQKEWQTVGKGWGMLNRSVNRISLLVLDMLDYSKEREPVRHPVDPLYILREVVQVLESEAERKGVTVTLAPNKDIPPVSIDGDRVFRCLLNLATNALDAIEENTGRVELGARLLAADDPAALPPPQGLMGNVVTLALWVSDNGCGIEPENLPKLFQPFFSTKGSKGTGIGLAVTQKIVNEHKGRIIVESEPGKGTTFRLLIPCPLEAPQWSNPI